MFFFQLIFVTCVKINIMKNSRELAKGLKRRFGITYRVKGMNIYVNDFCDKPKDIVSYLELVNEEFGLGYKRFFVKEKEGGDRTLIGSVPFGIAITINPQNT